MTNLIMGLRQHRPSVDVAAAAWGVTYEYAEWSAIGEQFKLYNVQQSAELDVEHQHVNEYIYAVQQPEYVGIDVCYFGFRLIRIVEHELAQSSETHFPLFLESGFLCPFKQGKPAAEQHQ